jgi:DNA-binding NarL/FixJ family response regulator
MARRPTSMNKQTEITRLKSLGLKERAIARTLKMSRKTVSKYLTKQPPVLAVESEQRFS